MIAYESHVISELQKVDELTDNISDKLWKVYDVVFRLESTSANNKLEEMVSLKTVLFMVRRIY